jgi:2-phosphosulfolactate phosphatase
VDNEAKDSSIFSQGSFELRFEWGVHGLETVSTGAKFIVIVDVLSFSTSVDIATAQGAHVFPYRWKDSSAKQFAKSVDAELADKSNPLGRTLSPSSLLNLPAQSRLVLPSPNGAMLSSLSKDRPTLCACLRNFSAVAAYISERGGPVAVLAAGEQWDDGSLRPAIEDLLGAGALLSKLPGAKSPEAQIAAQAFLGCFGQLHGVINSSSSGRELTARGRGQDVDLAVQADISSAVPLLAAGAYINQR